MALEYASGAIEWLGTDAAGTTYTVSGLSFQPKALRFYTTGITGAGIGTDFTTSTQDERASVGFATSTSDRRCVAAFDDDGAGTMICSAGLFEDAVLSTVNGTPARDGALDLNAINSDGFQLIVDDQAPQTIVVFWEAWGGSDISNAGTFSFAEPAATGNQDYATGGVQASVAMFAGCQSTAAAGTAQRNDSGLMVGAASSGAGSDQFVCVGNNDDGSASSDVDTYARGDECVAMITVAGGNPSARATLTQFDATTGIRLNWLARATTNRRYIGLWMAGGQWKGGTITIDGTTIGNTASVTGLAFAPKGVSICTAWATQDAVGTSHTGEQVSWGSGVSPSSRRCQGFLIPNGAGSSDVTLTVIYSNILSNNFAADEIDLDAMLSDGFRLIVTQPGPSATQWNGYLVFGDAAVGRIFKLAGEGGGLAGPMRGLAG